MKTLYLLFLPLTVILLAIVYSKYGIIMTLFGGGLYVLGWACHKHRTYLKEVADRPKDYVEDKLSGWFRS